MINSSSGKGDKWAVWSPELLVPADFEFAKSNFDVGIDEKMD